MTDDDSDDFDELEEFDEDPPEDPDPDDDADDDEWRSPAEYQARSEAIIAASRVRHEKARLERHKDRRALQRQWGEQRSAMTLNRNQRRADAERQRRERQHQAELARRAKRHPVPRAEVDAVKADVETLKAQLDAMADLARALAGKVSPGAPQRARRAVEGSKPGSVQRTRPTSQPEPLKGPPPNGTKGRWTIGSGGEWIPVE